jgi:tetratricopeptide (TPR) repeat protein
VCPANAKTKSPGRHPGRWWIVGCLVAVSAAAGPWIWNQARFSWRVHAARHALTRFAADEALIELTAAKKLRPGSAEIEYLLGVAHRKLGHIDDVRSHIETAGRLGWPRKDVNFQLTLLAFQAGDTDAESELKKMMLHVRDDDTAQELYESLSLGYLDAYRVDDAMLVLRHWIEWQPNCIRPRLLRAEIFAIAHLPVQQEEEYRKVLESEPENYAAHFGLAHVLERNHDTEQALAHFRFCHQRSPDDADASAGIASCLNQQGKLPESREVLTDLLRQENLSPQQRALALSAMAEMAEQERKWPSAIQLLSESVELDPYNTNWHYRLGVCLAKSGRHEESNRYLERATELDQLWQRRLDLELQMASEPSNAEVRFELGKVLAKLGYEKPSAAIMLSVLRCDPNHQGAHAALVQYYEETGREDLAQKHRTASEQPNRADGQSAAPPSDLPDLRRADNAARRGNAGSR